MTKLPANISYSSNIILYNANNVVVMISDQGEFLIDINQFLAELRELEHILKEYQVDSISELKMKIEEKKVPEHPSYEEYLDALHLFDSLNQKQTSIMRSIQGVELDNFK